MAERYIRPPIVGAEPRSDRLAVWRFRLLLLLVVIALAIVVVEVIQLAGAGNTEQRPSLTGGLGLFG